MACGAGGTCVVVTMFEWVQQMLPHHCGLGPQHSLYVYTFNMLLKGTCCRKQFGAFCQMLTKLMPPQVGNVRDFGFPLDCAVSTQIEPVHPSRPELRHCSLSISSALRRLDYQPSCTVETTSFCQVRRIFKQCLHQ